jgi:hypothetical protein
LVAGLGTCLFFARLDPAPLKEDERTAVEQGIPPNLQAAIAASAGGVSIQIPIV